MRFVAPQAQDDVERLARHLAVDAGGAVHLEHRPVGRQARRGDAEIEPPFRRGDPASPRGRRVRRDGGTAAGTRPARCAGAWSAAAPARSAGPARDAVPMARCSARRSRPRRSRVRPASAASAGPSRGRPSALARADGRAWRNNRIPWRFLLAGRGQGYTDRRRSGHWWWLEPYRLPSRAATTEGSLSSPRSPGSAAAASHDHARTPIRIRFQRLAALSSHSGRASEAAW